MKEVRYRSIDLYKALALFLIIFNHAWVRLGNFPINNNVIAKVMSTAGEIGVTMFFIISGFGIFVSLNNRQTTYVNYLKARFWRIVPAYYFAILIAITITSSAIYFSKEGLKDIITHLLFIHSFWIETQGSIFGVFWTMAITVQFYLIAPLLKKAIDRRPAVTLLLSIIISCLLKLVIYHYVIPKFTTHPMAYFIYGRQLFTAIDNFVVGMFIARLISQNKGTILKIRYIVITILFYAAVIACCFAGQKYGIYTDSVSGYIWHSILAVTLAAMIYFTAKCELNYNNIFARIMLFISKHEYGIYIWHLTIINVSISTSGYIIDQAANQKYFKIMLIWLMESLIVGIIYSFLIDSGVKRWREKFSVKKEKNR